MSPRNKNHVLFVMRETLEYEQVLHHSRRHPGTDERINGGRDSWRTQRDVCRLPLHTRRASIEEVCKLRNSQSHRSIKTKRQQDKISSSREGETEVFYKDGYCSYKRRIKQREHVKKERLYRV